MDWNEILDKIKSWVVEAGEEKCRKFQQPVKMLEKSEWLQGDLTGIGS